MIYTVTLNPAVDVVVRTDELLAGGTLEGPSIRIDITPGGKGINVSRFLWNLGRETLAIVGLAGRTGEIIKSQLQREEQIPTMAVPLRGDTRVNLFIYEGPAGRRTRLREPGPQLGENTVSKVLERLERATPNDMVVIAGNLPADAPPYLYRILIEELRNKDIQTILDTRSGPLGHGLEAGPYMVKPDDEEAGELLGKKILTMEDALWAAREIRGLGAEIAVVTMGALGAAIATPRAGYVASPPVVPVHSPVGCGDATLAGMVLGLSQDWTITDTIRYAMGAGAAAARAQGRFIPRAEEVEELAARVRVEQE